MFHYEVWSPLARNTLFTVDGPDQKETRTAVRICRLVYFFSVKITINNAVNRVQLIRHNLILKHFKHLIWIPPLFKG